MGVKRRKNIPKDVQLKVWNRDHWTCQYCGEPVFFAPTLKLFDKLSPGHGYYHQHGKADEILELFQWRWASVDHVIPHAEGGEDDESNFVTSCWECNLTYREKPVFQGKPNPGKCNLNNVGVNWDGLSSLYPKLCGEIDEWVKIISKT